VRFPLRFFAAVVVACVLAPGAFAGPHMFVGAAEDGARQTDPLVAQTKMDLAKAAGFSAIRTTVLWRPGKAEIEGWDLETLTNAALAAQFNGIRLIVSVYPFGSSVTPLTPAARTEFSTFAASIPVLVPWVRDVIVGNEPNLNRFWMPQFTPAGRDAAAPAYVALLSQTYDLLKAVAPGILVYGGAVSPRGFDKPGLRPTHSPVTFIPDMGTAYRASGRTKPIMDAFAFHPYMDYSRTPPTLKHPAPARNVAINDYARLVGLLGKAFDGTAQRGSRLPILYDEFGVQTQIQDARLTSYSNPAAVGAWDAVPEATQASYYRTAIELAYCQKNVIGLLFFHVSDEADLAAWQSGVYYSDDTPKTSLASVRDAALSILDGTFVTTCGY
jgi:hypothetical protein